MSQRSFKFPPSTFVKKCASAKICKNCRNFYNIGPNLTYNISKCAQFFDAHTRTISNYEKCIEYKTLPNEKR